MSLSLLGLSIASPSWAGASEKPGAGDKPAAEKPPAEKPGDKPAAPPSEEKPADKAKTPLGLRFDALSTTVSQIDGAAVPCKLGERAVGCLEAAKAATLDLRLVRKQLAKDIRNLRKAGDKKRLAHALEFGSSLNQLKASLRSLGAADSAAAAQESLGKLREQLGTAKLQLEAFN